MLAEYYAKLGAVPPASLSQWQFIVAGLLPGPLTFYFYLMIERIRNPVLVFDTVGL
jgi:hypothetical protein